MQEGERQIDRAGLVASVFRFRYAGLLSHLLFGEAGDAAHLADTERDLHQGAYGGGRCCLGRHGGIPPSKMKNKKLASRNLLRRAENQARGTTQIAAKFLAAASDPDRSYPLTRAYGNTCEIS